MRPNDNAARKPADDDDADVRSDMLRGADGALRTQLIARAMWPSTHALLNRIGIHRGMQCLDVGCGTGDVTLQVARMVAPEGQTLGVDADAVIVQQARAAAARQQSSARFEAMNAEELCADAAYDFVHTRFLLSHLAQPEELLARLVRALRPGGTLVAVDVDFAGHVCHPACTAFERYLELYQAVVRRRGGNPAIGPHLPGLLRAAGAEDLRLEVVQPTFCDGEGKYAAAMTLEHIREAVVLAGFAAHAEIDALVVELEAFANDASTILSLPRVFQVWGRRPDGVRTAARPKRKIDGHAAFSKPL
jgi:SAM-dependent methyltransferase